MTTDTPGTAPLSGLVETVRASPAWFAAYLSSPPVEAQFKVNGSTPLQRVQTLFDKWERQQRAAQIERYNALRSSTREDVQEADEALPVVEAKIERWVADMNSGRLSPEQVMRNLAECAPVLSAAQAEYDAAEANAAAAEAMVDLTPGEYREYLDERFPSMAGGGLPLITEAWLKGERGAPDPLGGQS